MQRPRERAGDQQCKAERQAQGEGADFVAFGPVFDTASKQVYGAPAGLARLQEVAFELTPFPVFALGGITADNAVDCLQVGAMGLAGISLFKDPGKLKSLVGLFQGDLRKSDLA